MAIVDTLYQMREEGLNTPQFAFHTGDGTDGTNKLAAYLYKNLYSTGKYRELWFMWDGKPLMLGNSTQLSAQYRNVFTFRRSWAWQSGEINSHGWTIRRKAMAGTNLLTNRKQPVYVWRNMQLQTKASVIRAA